MSYARGEKKTIGEALDGHRNSFGVLRLVFAGLVIYAHAWDMGGWGIDPVYRITRDQFHLGTFAVYAFLGISGYVVTKSAISNDGLQFFWRRALRIFPAFWTVLAVSAFIVGPINWKLNGNGIRAYFTADENNPITYITRNWTLDLGQSGIAGLFTSNPFPDVANRSLWTLNYEWGCYILVGLIAITGILTHARWVIPALAVVFALLEVLYLVNPEIRYTFDFLPDVNTRRFTLVFLWGATYAVYSKTIRFNDILGVSAIAVVVAASLIGGFFAIGLPALLYALIYAAVRLPAAVQVVGRKNDYSYGLYLYGALVQQIGAALGWYQWGFWPWTLTSVALALGCAWISWHLVEKRAMSLKDVGPGRGIRYWIDKRYPAPDAVPEAA